MSSPRLTAVLVVWSAVMITVNKLLLSSQHSVKALQIK